MNQGANQDMARGAALCLDDGMNNALAQGMNNGLRKITQIAKIDALLLLDGDLADSASEAEQLLVTLKESRSDLVIGVLPTPPGTGGFGAVKNLARQAILAQMDRLKINDLDANFPLAPLSGQRAIKLSALSSLRPFAPSFAIETIMTIRALRQGLKIVEVPVNITHAATGRNISGFLHRLRQYLDIRRALKDTN
jgi:hypothetical protein